LDNKNVAINLVWLSAIDVATSLQTVEQIYITQRMQKNVWSVCLESPLSTVFG